MNYRFCPRREWRNQFPGRVDQSSQVEHYLRRDKGRLREVYDKTQLEVTTETDVAGARCLVCRRLCMKDVVNVQVHQPSLQMQVRC